MAINSTTIEPLVHHTPHEDADVDAAVHNFVAAVNGLQWVRMIARDGRSSSVRVWTIISAPPFDSSFRRPIYDAQVAVLGAMARPSIEFRLVNVREVEDEVADILPTVHQTLYQREAEA